MNLKIINGDILEAQAEALFLTIDGDKKGMAGNIAQQFAKKWPDVWAELVDEVPYPIGLGDVFDYEPASECQFRLIILASTLHHKDTLSENGKKAVVRTALENILTVASEYKIQTIAGTIMQGGWRLPDVRYAFKAMHDSLSGFSSANKDLSLHIYIKETKNFEIIQSLAFTLGWR